MSAPIGFMFAAKSLGQNQIDRSVSLDAALHDCPLTNHTFTQQKNWGRTYPNVFIGPR